MARFGAEDVERLLADAGIVRHRGKIESAINNAQRVLELRERVRLAGGLRLALRARSGDAAEAHHARGACRRMTTSPESIAMSKDLKKRGWSFVGPTTVYAFMQAMGLVNDHIEGCHAREQALKARAELEAAALPRATPPAARPPSGD